MSSGGGRGGGEEGVEGVGKKEVIRRGERGVEGVRGG